MVLCTIVSCQAEQITVQDRYLVGSGNSYKLIIEDVDGSVYYYIDNSFTFEQPLDRILGFYETFAPNTTHTVELAGHRVL